MEFPVLMGAGFVFYAVFRAISLLKDIRDKLDVILDETHAIGSKGSGRDRGKIDSEAYRKGG